MFFFSAVAEEPGDFFGHLDGSWWGWSFVVAFAFTAVIIAAAWIVLFLFAGAVIHVGFFFAFEVCVWDALLSLVL